MAKNFQRDKFKYNPENQVDKYNPEFNSFVKPISDEKAEEFLSLQDIFYYLSSFYRWFPDLFLDTMTPKDSKKTLNLYQRVLLRVLFRFMKTYTTIPRSSAKSFIQLLAYMLMAVMFPNIKLSIIAETKEQSASIISDKYNEITGEWYPFFKDEVASTKFSRDMAVIEFHNGSRIDNLGNAQTTKILVTCIEIYKLNFGEPTNVGCVVFKTMLMVKLLTSKVEDNTMPSLRRNSFEG